MFKHLFGVMNEMLDELARRYADPAHADSLDELDRELAELKRMSDQCIEGWLLFEERISRLSALRHGSSAEGDSVKHSAQTDGNELDEWTAMHLKARENAAFEQAQGYYQLRMYDEAIRLLEPLAERQPDFILARLYLAMGYLKSERFEDAYRQFQFVQSFSEHAKIKSISFNAMGCIQAKRLYPEKAAELFKLAYEADPTNRDALTNLECFSQAGSGHRLSVIGLS
ncbi:hypothetical protein ACFQWB_11230 [Paenibacillus thermoaerophilus]|uniref:Tetratricopeptide repeat-containing protein n=1 Tax=Paenibacillus thermoaerophilus TaxID=1215385 RepID=A0ABW2V4Z4_9BACL|nr:hypothetical protein [Paenibacillus thermoaerophilus]TMV18672.1 hypothetical protein FE781_01665 [Paenibacillus thermoaerophilus]